LNVIGSTVAGDTPAESMNAKITKAGTQFEAILLNNVLGDLERAFTDLPGKKEDNSSQAYSSFAMQGLASGLAQAGGIGIGRMIAKALARHTEPSAGDGITLANKSVKNR
jgi:Rod binding domain-containing protein